MNRRGLTLMELMLSLAITAIVGLGIAGMMGVVAIGVDGRRDTRAVTVLANAAASRLASYVGPSRCILAADGGNLTLWFNDSRESGTVHATELRWLKFDADAGTVSVHYVEFPEAWGQPARDLEDHEYSSGTDWETVLAEYEARRWTGSRILIDQLAAANVMLNDKTVLNSRFVSYELGFQTQADVVDMVISATINQHMQPVK